MLDFILSSSYFCITLTLAAFALGSFVQKKTKLAVLNPILVGAAIVMLVLTVLDIPNATYQAGCGVLNSLLTPATICLSIAFHQQFQALKKHLAAITLGVLAGSLCSIGFIWLAARFFGLERAVLLSLLPKSITTAIGTAISEEIGGIAAVTTFAIAITGIFGYISSPALCKLFRIRNKVAQGVAFGTAAHVIGTTKATQLHPLTGAVSSLSLTTAGLITVLVLSFLSQFL